MSNEPTIEQINETIALFDGWAIREDVPLSDRPKLYIKDKVYRLVCELKYHLSWDWLMNVVEKIDKEHAHVRIQVGICAITYRFMDQKKFAKDKLIQLVDVPPIAEHNEHGFLGNVYRAVYDFIQWYNKQKEV